MVPDSGWKQLNDAAAWAARMTMEIESSRGHESLAIAQGLRGTQRPRSPQWNAARDPETSGDELLAGSSPLEYSAFGALGVKPSQDRAVVAAKRWRLGRE